MSNSAVALSLDEFNSQVANYDFQRTNMFSMHFATRPSSKSQEYLGVLATAESGDSVGQLLNEMGVTNEGLQSAIKSIVSIGAKKVVRKAGVKKILMGAMTNRVLRTMFGELRVGTYLLEYFDTLFPTSGLLVQAVKIPDSHLNHEIDRQHNAPNIKIMGRDYEPLVITFRMDADGNNHRAMTDWVNAVEDPVTGLRALPVDVEADIQINLHKRNGLPHTVFMFTGCVPVICGGPTMSYEDNNQITVFDVTFAYRVMGSSAVGVQAAQEWMDGIQRGQYDINMNASASRLG